MIELELTSDLGNRLTLLRSARFDLPVNVGINVNSHPLWPISISYHSL